MACSCLLDIYNKYFNWNNNNSGTSCVYNGNATPDDVLLGKTFYGNSSTLLRGTIETINLLNFPNGITANNTYTVSKGYYPNDMNFVVNVPVSGGGGSSTEVKGTLSIKIPDIVINELFTSTTGSKNESITPLSGQTFNFVNGTATVNVSLDRNCKIFNITGNHTLNLGKLTSSKTEPLATPGYYDTVTYTIDSSGSVVVPPTSNIKVINVGYSAGLISSDTTYSPAADSLDYYSGIKVQFENNAIVTNNKGKLDLGNLTSNYDGVLNNPGYYDSIKYTIPTTPTYNTEEKTFDIGASQATSTVVILPSTGKDAMTKVTLSCSDTNADKRLTTSTWFGEPGKIAVIPTSDIHMNTNEKSMAAGYYQAFKIYRDLNLLDKEVTLSTASETYTADSSYSGLSSIKVNMDTSNISGDNILLGSSVAGVQGTLIPVFFDANGGNMFDGYNFCYVPNNTILLQVGYNGRWPGCSKTNYTFIGWNTDKFSTTALPLTTPIHYDPNNLFNSNNYLYAIYKVKNITITVNGNGGTYNGSSTKTISVPSGSTMKYISSLIPHFSNSGTFAVGYNGTGNVADDPFALSTVFTSDTTIYALYGTNSNNIIITFKTNGGTIAGSTAKEFSISVPKGTPMNSIIPNYVNPAYTVTKSVNGLPLSVSAYGLAIDDPCLVDNEFVVMDPAELIYSNCTVYYLWNDNGVSGAKVLWLMGGGGSIMGQSSYMYLLLKDFYGVDLTGYPYSRLVSSFPVAIRNGYKYTDWIFPNGDPIPANYKFSLNEQIMPKWISV